MRFILPTICLICLLLTGSAAHAQALQAGLEVVGGTYRMFTSGEPVLLRLTVGGNGERHAVQVRVRVYDIFGRLLAPPQQYMLQPKANETTIEADVALPKSAITPAPGYYRVEAEFVSGAARVVKATDLGVIPPPHPGLRPESFIASNTSSIRTGEELKFLRMIGMKIQRTHFSPRLAGPVPPTSTGAALPLNFTESDRALAEAKAGDTWVLPIAGYAFEGTRSKLAEQTGMYGPPRDYAEFVNTWEQILRHYPEITTYEFWNEPWIFGWTWAASGEEYRKLQKAWCEMALRVHPGLRIIAGNSSMFTEDHIEPDPDSWRGLLQGTTHHPYSYSVGQPTLRAGDQGRSIDHGAVVNRRMGLPYYYLTEGGTEYALPVAKPVAGGTAPATTPDGFDPKDNSANACKIVQYFVRAALEGAYMGNAQWGIGYGPGWTRSNTSFAVMSHFLEDRPVLAEIWPSHELIWGAVFADSRFATPEVKALPRASELTARWHLEGPRFAGAVGPVDTTKVAVIWSQTGQSNEQVDRGGTLTIANAAGLHAYDLTGRAIPGRAGHLTVAFGEYPVYITTDTLSVVELRRRIADATIQHVTPVNMYALSLTRPANESQWLAVRVENQLNRPVGGTLKLQRTGDKSSAVAKFTIPSGALIEVPIRWLAAKVSPQNQYGVTLTATSDAGDSIKRQVLAVAQLAHRTIKVNGALDDWRGTVPVLLDSEQLRTGVDLTQYLLNPHLERPTGTAGTKRVVARVYTAYDAANVYIAAAVNEDALKCTAGQPATRGRGADKVELPYRTGLPDGLDHIRNCGDAFLFAFGFRDRVPGWGRQMNDPYAWKGHFYDTDYHYAAHISTDGPQLIRQWGPDTTRRTAYQTEPVPGYGLVPGAHIEIKRDEAAKLTLYEMSIPRTELALFNPAQGCCRFGFMLSNDENLGQGGALQWSEAAGVFDHWRSSGSFGPSWQQVLPCQTFFSIAR